MITHLLMLGLFAASGGGADSGPVAVPQARTAVLAVAQGSTDLGTGIAQGAAEWQQPYDPADHVPYAVDWSNLLDDGETIAGIAAIRLSSAAAALGFAVDTAAGFAPRIDSVSGRLVQLWFVVPEGSWDAASYSAAGVRLGVTVRIVTDAAAPKTIERTAVMRVRQL